MAVYHHGGGRQGGLSGDGGPATQAQLRDHGVAVAPDGSLYMAETDNNRMRRVGPDGVITTVAGTGQKGFSGEGGPATQAQIDISSWFSRRSRRQPLPGRHGQ